MITGEANINFRNAFGGGETIGLNWQQLQVKSPRLNIFYQHPYFSIPRLGLILLLICFERTAAYLNINLNLGASMFFQNQNQGKFFFSIFKPSSARVALMTQSYCYKNSLPDIADVSSLAIGMDYEKNNTNYRFNPRNGYEFRIRWYQQEQKKSKRITRYWS